MHLFSWLSQDPPSFELTHKIVVREIFKAHPLRLKPNESEKWVQAIVFAVIREAIDASSISKTVQACLVNRGSHVQFVSGAPTSLAFTSGDIIPCRIPCRPACSPARCHRCSGNGFRNGTALHSAAQDGSYSPKTFRIKCLVFRPATLSPSGSAQNALIAQFSPSDFGSRANACGIRHPRYE